MVSTVIYGFLLVVLVKKINKFLKKHRINQEEIRFAAGKMELISVNM